MDTELKLLLLEDNPDDAGLIQKLLQRAGMNFTAKVVSDEQEFLKILDENGFDVVLADNALPQYNSLEALEVIKERNPFIAFILVTGTVSEEFAVKIIQQGADDYILKNNLTRLPAAITKAIENKKLQKEKQEAEKEMQEMNEQLRKLAAHLQKVKEEEQARLAREMHDQLGQIITSLKMDLGWIKKNKKELIPGIVQKRLNEMSHLLDEAVVTIRKVAADLRPSILDDLGLADTLEWHSKEFKKRSGIHVQFRHTTKGIKFDTDIATGLFRIYQEALTNVARHAKAKNVTTRLDVNGDKITLSIQDDGKGFDTTIQMKTLGLLGMRERARMMNGTVEITSEPGKGTTVLITIPHKENKSHKQKVDIL